MKKVLSIILTLMLMLPLLPQGIISLNTSAAIYYTYGDLTYTVSKGEVTITDCKTTATEVEIPSTIQGYPVTSIGEEAFFSCGKLAKITIPNGVISIGKRAFQYCYSLTSITIPDSVMSIGDYAFYNCYRLKSIDIPDSVTSIGAHAFYECDSLTSIDISDSITSIEQWTFYGCDSLTSINLPDGLIIIGNRAFENCAFTNITIPNNVTSIGDFAFINCDSLTSITIPDSVTNIGRGVLSSCDSLTSISISEGNSVYHSAGNCIIESETKSLIQGCNNSVIPTDGSITIIGGSAFDGHSSLTSIDIPDSVTSIGEGAFSWCTSLTSVDIPDSVTSIEASTFNNCSSLTSIDIPDGATSIGYGAFQNCISLTNIDIPDSLTSIGDMAFYNCESLTSITIPDSVTYIGYYAFADCENLTSITISNNITDIEKYTFEACTSLTSIDIPDGVTSIGKAAFSGCESLKSIVIPSSVTSIGESAFQSCNSLKNAYYLGPQKYKATITIESNNDKLLYAKWIYHTKTRHVYDNACDIDCNECYLIREVGEHVYDDYLDYECNECGYIRPFLYTISDEEVTITDCHESATKVVIPSTIEGYPVTSIGEAAFGNCRNLTSITIPDTVTTIGYDAFANCTSLASITIPSSVIGIGNGAFYGCESLTSITIPDKVTTIGEHTFNYCTNLTSITIPNSVTTIGEGAFMHCSSLKSITIPDGVTSIGKDTFYSCSSLTSINIPDTVTSIGIYAFYECKNLTHIILPDSVTTIGAWAFFGCTNLTNITIPDGVTTIDEFVFYNCTKLTSITIPDSVTSIREAAFGDFKDEESTTLSKIYYEGSQADREEILIEAYNNILLNAEWFYNGCRGHNFGDWYETKAATCLENGEKRRDCVNNDAFETEIIPATGHTYETVVTAPTCIEQGYTTYICHCGDNYFENYLPATGHAYNNDFAPDCNICGEIRAVRKFCDFDDDGKITVADALAVLRIAAQLTECTNDTLKLGDKDGDGRITVADALAILRVSVCPHAEAVDSAVAATCTETGLTEGKHCPRCFEVLVPQTTIAALGHVVVVESAVAATCTETGLTKGTYCSRCSEVLVPQTITKLLPHKFNNDICDICNIEGKATYSYWDGSIAESFHAGDGSKENPYRIQSGEELALLSSLCYNGNADYSNKYYILEMNIDLHYLDWVPIGREYQESASKPIETQYSFCGNFDGNGHVIKGLSDVLFGYINSASIKSLGTIDVNIQKVSGAGFVKKLVDSNISNCFSHGVITARSHSSYSSSAAFGFFAYASGVSRISDCYANVEVSSYSPSLASAGGFGGDLGKGSAIDRCYSIGNVSCISSNNTAYAGGLLGGWNSGTIKDSFAAGNIYVEGKFKEYGQLCSYVYYTGTVSNSYSNCVIDALDNGNAPTVCKAGITDFDKDSPDFYQNTIGLRNDWDISSDGSQYPKLKIFYTLAEL